MSETETETPAAPVKNKGGRPRKTVAAAPMLSDAQFAQLLGAITANRGGGGMDPSTLKDALASAAVLSAQTMQKAMKPENQAHPGRSALSYPEGDVARPRPVPPFEFWYNGYPCSKFPETEHYRELELMCDVEPGDYMVIRTDGSKMHVIAIGTRDAEQRITKLEVFFGERNPQTGQITNTVSRHEKNLIPPKAVVLYQMVHAGERSPRQLFVEALNEWLTITLGDPVAA